MGLVRRKIGAIYKVDDVKQEVHFLGYGRLTEREVPMDACGLKAEILKFHGIKDPTFNMDKCGKLYHCECSWDHITDVKKFLDKCKHLKYNVVEVDIRDIRKQFKLDNPNFEKKVLNKLSDKPKPKRGRPKGKRDSKPRKPKGNN